MNTRTEGMNNKVYCAYCGKELRDCGNCFVHVYPEQSLVCNCEKAKRELELYDELKSLYNTPLAETLIDMKVNEYRNRLLGTNNQGNTTATITLCEPITGNGSYSHSYVSV